MSRNQIEISNAASVAAHDEATTYYLDIIDNFRAGAEWYKEKLEKNGFNKLQSTSAWMVDAFGHSLASMRLQKMNQMHNLIIGRASTVEKKVRGLTNELYFDWVYNFEQPSTNFNEKKPVSKANTTMKTYLLLDTYCSPYSVKRTRFQDELTIINPLDKDFYITILYFQQFIKQNIIFAKNSYLNITLNTIGDDFEFTKAESLYNKLDAYIWIAQMNSGQKNSAFGNMTIRYSRIEQFFKAQQEK